MMMRFNPYTSDIIVFNTIYCVGVVSGGVVELPAITNAGEHTEHAQVTKANESKKGHQQQQTWTEGTRALMATLMGLPLIYLTVLPLLLHDCPWIEKIDSSKNAWFTESGLDGAFRDEWMDWGITFSSKKLISTNNSICSGFKKLSEEQNLVIANSGFSIDFSTKSAEFTGNRLDCKIRTWPIPSNLVNIHWICEPCACVDAWFWQDPLAVACG
jgi:hypothetical protein